MNGGWVLWLIGGLLGLSLTASIVLVRSATADSSFVAEPHYYADAVAWDDHMARERESAELGWHVSARLERVDGGRAKLIVILTDRNDVPVRDARVQAVASPNLCGQRRATIELLTVGDASEGLVGAACPGIWRIDVTAVRGNDIFVTRAIAELARIGHTVAATAQNLAASRDGTQKTLLDVLQVRRRRVFLRAAAICSQLSRLATRRCDRFGLGT